MERLDCMTVREKDGKSYFTKIGVAFPAKDGNGWNVYLDALPVNGQIIMRPPKPRDDAYRNAAQPVLPDDRVPF